MGPGKRVGTTVVLDEIVEAGDEMPNANRNTLDEVVRQQQVNVVTLSVHTCPRNDTIFVVRIGLKLTSLR